MPILAWRPHSGKPQSHRRTLISTHGRVPGAYAGRARFRPIRKTSLPPVLQSAIGRVVELAFAGIAQGGDPFAGQPLYLEWCRDDVFDGFLIPEQDLEFLKESPDPNGSLNVTDRMRWRSPAHGTRLSVAHAHAGRDISPYFLPIRPEDDAHNALGVDPFGIDGDHCIDRREPC